VVAVAVAVAVVVVVVVVVVGVVVRAAAARGRELGVSRRKRCGGDSSWVVKRTQPRREEKGGRS
jgi:hypothetical protein